MQSCAVRSSLRILLCAAVCLMAAAHAHAASGLPVPQVPPADDTWVRYSLPGTSLELTMRWLLAGTDGEQLVIKVETYIDGQLRSTKEIRRAPLKVPAEYRREAIVAGGRKYDCKVFQQGPTTYWYSEDVPLLGIVRSQTGEHEVMELVEASPRRQR
jgi:hypothetical protein